MSGEFVASLLQGSASGYAGLAAGELLQQNEDLRSRYGASAFDQWKAHLEQRIAELATAVAFDEPRLLAAQVRWSLSAFVARGYDLADLAASLDALAGVLEEQLPEAAHAFVLPVLSAAKEELERPPEEEKGLDPADELQRLALRYLERALTGDRRGAAQILVKALDGGRSLLEIYEQILTPAQREIGRLWHRGEINVAEEHVATAITQRTMAILSQRCEPEKPNGRTVAAASVAGNVHDMALRVAADVFEHAGWQVVLLGPDLPTTDFVEAVAAFAPDLLLLSASMPQQLPGLKTALAALRQAVDGERPKVLVGGRAFLDIPELWRRVGADGHASTLKQALEEGQRLVEADSSSR